MNPMTATVEITCPEDAALIERYALMLRESRALAATTPLAELIDVCEMSVIEKGREVNRATLEDLVQQRLRDVEKKGVASLCLRESERESWAGEAIAVELPGIADVGSTILSMPELSAGARVRSGFAFAV